MIGPSPKANDDLHQPHGGKVLRVLDLVRADVCACQTLRRNHSFGTRSKCGVRGAGKPAQFFTTAASARRTFRAHEIKHPKDRSGHAEPHNTTPARTFHG